MFERASIYQLHHDIEMPVTFVCIMDGHNIRMRKASNKASFPVKAFHKVAVGSKPGRKNLDRHFAVEVLLIALIDASHAPLSEGSKDSVVARHCTDQIVLFHRQVR